MSNFKPIQKINVSIRVDPMVLDYFRRTAEKPTTEMANALFKYVTYRKNKSKKGSK